MFFQTERGYPFPMNRKIRSCGTPSITGKRLNSAHITCPTARKRAVTVPAAIFYHRKIVISSSHGSMLKLKAFLREASIGFIGCPKQ